MPPRIDPSVPDEATLAFEALVTAKVTADVATLVRDLIARILAAWEVLARAGITAAAASSFAATVALRLRSLRWSPMDPRLRTAAREARSFGVTRVLERLDEPVPRVDVPAAPAPRADAALREALAKASDLAKHLDLTRRGNVSAVLGKAGAGLSAAQGHARWTANEGINAGTAAVAQATGRNLVWVAERGACLHCLAHAGWVVEPGTDFPPVSFDPRAAGVPAVSWPPLHPNCRCEVRVYAGPAGPPERDVSRLDPAARLAAEARRSVVYQWTDHASNVAAQRAAAALLRVGADLPRTVQERARRAVKRGGVRRPGR